MLCHINIHLYYSLHINKTAFDEYKFVFHRFLCFSNMCHKLFTLWTNCHFEQYSKKKKSPSPRFFMVCESPQKYCYTFQKWKTKMFLYSTVKKNYTKRCFVKFVKKKKVTSLQCITSLKSLQVAVFKKKMTESLFSMWRVVVNFWWPSSCLCLCSARQKKSLTSLSETRQLNHVKI